MSFYSSGASLVSSAMLLFFFFSFFFILPLYCVTICMKSSFLLSILEWFSLSFSMSFFALDCMPYTFFALRVVFSSLLIFSSSRRPTSHLSHFLSFFSSSRPVTLFQAFNCVQSHWDVPRHSCALNATACNSNQLDAASISVSRSRFEGVVTVASFSSASLHPQLTVLHALFFQPGRQHSQLGQLDYFVFRWHSLRAFIRIIQSNLQMIDESKVNQVNDVTLH